MSDVGDFMENFVIATTTIAVAGLVYIKGSMVVEFNRETAKGISEWTAECQFPGGPATGVAYSFGNLPPDRLRDTVDVFTEGGRREGPSRKCAFAPKLRS